MLLRALGLKDSFRSPSSTRKRRYKALNMPTDIARVLEIAQEISKVAQHLTKEGSLLSNASREELVRNAEILAIAAREPEENLYFQATQV